MNNNDNIATARFFKQEELICKCGCNHQRMDQSLLNSLDFIRNQFNKPIILSSAYRCPMHDRSIGGANVHTTGKAVDISISGIDAYDLLNIIMMSKWFTGIGIKQSGNYNSRFIHIDNLLDKNSRPRLWSYE